MPKKSSNYNIQNQNDMRLALLLDFLEEDLGRGDITTDALGISGKCRAEVFARQPCVVAGISAITPLVKHFKIKITVKKTDGRKCKKGDVIFKLEGDGATVLNLERLILNVISRMSGIATSTREVVELVLKINPNCLPAATRKTTPGFRLFEKDAVIIGGGHPHRFDLAEAVLIKDNHLKFVENPEDALKLAGEHVGRLPGRKPTSLKWGTARPRNRQKWIEIEADCEKMAVAAAGAGADIIMLDNMTPAQAARTYKKLKEINKNILVEISGGITSQNIVKYAKYADIISLGWLTHSAPAVDFSMNVEKILK